MRIRIETNFNYYEDQPLLNTDVLEYPPNKSDEKINQFYGKKRKQKSDEIDSLFTSVLLVSSKNLENDDAYKDLIISSIRRKMEKEDDDLILKLYSKKVPSKSVADFFIQTGLYAGIIYIPSNKGAVEIHIKPRYGNVLLNRMLNVTNHIYMESGAFSAAKTKDNDDYFKYIIEYLFLHAYEKARLVGFPRQYVQIRTQSRQYKGSLDISKHIKYDIPFKGNLSLLYREQVIPQELIDVLYATFQCLQKSAYNVTKVKKYEQELKPMCSGCRLKKGDIQKIQRNKAVQNPLYAPFKKVLKYAEIILKNYNVLYDEQSKETKIRGFLIDISELWEIYLENLLRINFPGWSVSGQSEISFYQNKTFFGRKLMPDLVMRKDDKIAVFDAKFKTMQGRQKDVDLSDLRQIHTYAGFFSKDQDLVVAGLLYPCEKEPTEKWASNICSRTMNETKFIVDGINLENIQIDDYSTAFNQLVIEEKKFVERLRRYLD